MLKIKTYPTMNEVEAASHVELGRWWRFLESAKNPEQQKILNLICDRFHEMGGMTRDISEEVGWK